ncbi:cyclase family protein [Streptomyces sp. B6B3]|uniref:cyclase family protein n=1 Tax=Streptomyces sp. B6B3 TaxID=3153570 RepID=UPI00325FB6DA
MCSPALMRHVDMPAYQHVVHGGVVGEQADPDTSDVSHQVAARHAEHGHPHPDAELAEPTAGRSRPRRVGRRALFRLSAASTATIAAGAAMSGVASADTMASTLGRGGHRVADLTHELGEDFPVFYPLVDQPVFEQVRDLDIDGFNANQLTINEHAGTHIDVPGHFGVGAPTVEQLSAELLVVPLAVIRIADRAAQDPETLLTVRDIQRWESRNGRLPDRAFVAVDAGWWTRVRTPGAHLNEGADGVFRFPGISPEAAAFLVTERNVVGAGVDTSSLDGGVAAVPLTHQTLLPVGKYGIENMAALDTVPDKGALLIVGAPKHRGGFGGQVRALALY